MTTKATILQKENDILRQRVTELQNQLAGQTQTTLILQENEARLQSVLNNLLDAPYRRNLRTDCYDYLSPVIEQLTGWTVEEMNQADIETVLSWIHPDDLSQVQQEIERTHRLCQETGRATGGLEYRFRTKAGNYRWLGDYLTVIAGEDGQPLYRVGVVRDISERKQAEEALWQSEQKYRQLFSEMSSGGALHEIICDSDSRPVDYITLEVNHAYETFLNTKREAVIGRKASEVLPPAELKKWLEIFGPVALTGQSTPYEMFSPLNQKYFEGNVYCPEKGKFAVTFTDVTERKRAEAALRESEAKHRLISAMISDYLYAGLVYPDGKVETDWIIGPVQAITGYGEAELKTLPYGFASLVNPEDLAQVMAQQSKLLAGESMMVEYRITIKSGEERWMRDYIRPLQDETHAPAIRLLGAVQDITERKVAEEALRISEARYRLIADHLNDIIWQLNQELRFVYTSPAVEHILGYSVEEANQLSITDLLDAESLVLMRQIISRKLDQPEEKIDTITEYKMRHKAGHLVEVEVVSAPIFDEHGQYKGFTGVTRDIRERKHAQAAQIKLEEQLHQAQKMESIGRLAGGVAHDFNNLLTVILGYSELMQLRLPLEDRAREQLEQIRQAAKRAENLTRQLLAFSRKQMLIPEVLDLNGLVTNLRKLLERLIGEDIALITVLQPELWSVKADPGQIEQVIMNLAVNARDAMPTGGRLTIATANIPDASFSETPRGPGVRLTITDTGCGIDEAIQAHIFEPFFTTKEKSKGTGLGLSTVYGIVKQSGGEITVDSQPGQGAAFSFYLPAHKTDLTTSTAPQPELVAQPGRETILLVEDEKEVRNFVRVALHGYGYTLLEVDHGYQALALAQQEKFINLLLTDVVMPDINGRELAERIKALHPRIKVLFMSGYTDDEILQRGVQMAEVEFIAKPFSPVVLAAKVRAILDR